MSKDIWFCGDTHFGHQAILKHCNRPFSSVEEMDEILIQNINKLVKPHDTLYHLGDWAFRASDYKQYRPRIHCSTIHLLRGNHDKSLCIQQFRSIKELMDIDIGNQSIILCHYPMRSWNKSFHGSWQLYGHCHGNLEDDPNLLSFDVGVDCWNYEPINFDTVAATMKKKNVTRHYV